MPPTFEFILNDVADGQWIYTVKPSIRRVRDRLSAGQRAWLKRQIARIRPDDPWLPQLG